MKELDNAVAILDLVYASSSVAKTVTSSAIIRGNQFFVIPGKHGPRWIVPSYALFGKYVLSQWQPYNFMSLLKWRGLLFLYALGALGKVPGIHTIDVDLRSSLPIPNKNSSFIPIVYVGTPGPHQKAVVTLVAADSGKSQAVMKVALGDKAQTSLLREAMILEKLADINFPGVPALLAIEKDSGRTWQTIVTGRLTSRKLTQAHIDWLLQLPRSQNTTTLSEQLKRVQQSIELEKPPLSIHQKQLLSSVANVIQGERVIPLVLVHGDFAPWNLKHKNNGRITAIDWEDAQLEGLPLWDLCHFFLIQAYLFKEKKPVEKMGTSSLVQQYLKRTGLDENDLSALVFLYIFFTVYDEKSRSDDAYRTFLLNQIDTVLVG